nr:hypothetical protein [Tanacetum cinerariifolium]
MLDAFCAMGWQLSGPVSMIWMLVPREQPLATLKTNVCQQAVNTILSFRANECLSAGGEHNFEFQSYPKRDLITRFDSMMFPGIDCEVRTFSNAGLVQDNSGVHPQNAKSLSFWLGGNVRPEGPRQACVGSPNPFLSVVKASNAGSAHIVIQLVSMSDEGSISLKNKGVSPTYADLGDCDRRCRHYGVAC